MKELRPHQRKAVEELSNGKVLVGGVGTGKTLTALAYFQEKELGMVVGDFSSVKSPKDLYIFTTARKRDDLDWQLEASRMGMSTDREASATGVKVTVDSYNNIQKYKDIHNAFIILDEQRMVGNGTWTKTFIHLAKSNRWIMLSATPGDKWEDYIPLFLANGFYRNRTEFTREHLVYSYYGRYPKLESYLGVGKLTRLRNSITVDMPYERHTTRHIHDVEVEYDKELFRKVVKDRWHVYENRPLKDVSELFSVMRKVVNTDASRLEFLEKLLRTHPRLIVFYNFDYELEILRSLMSSKNKLSFEKDGYIPSDQIQTEWELSTSSIHSPEKLSIESTPALTNDGTEQIQPGLTSDSPSLSTRTNKSSSSLEKTPSSSNSEVKSMNGSSKKRNDASLVRTPATTCTKTGSDTWNGISEKPTPKPPSEKSLSNTLLSTPEVIGSSKFIGRQTLQESGSTSGLTLPKDQTSTKRCESSGSFETHTEELSEIPKKSSMTSTWDVLSESIQKPETTSSSPRKNESGSSNSSKIRTDTGFTVAEWNGHKHEKVPTTDRWVYLVQYAAGAEAWNCTSTDTIVFYSLTYSYRHFQQAQGRIDRLDTPFSHLHYYILKSKSFIDLAVAKALDSKKDFNEREQGLYTRV